MPADADKTRKAVEATYARAALRPFDPPEGDALPVPHGVMARSAGYSRDQLASVPREAVARSFGCGNPVASAVPAMGEVVLDIGCGAGIDLILAADRVGSGGGVIGVDMTGEMIGEAEKNIARSGRANIEVRRGLMEDLPVEDRSIDLVISNLSINLSPEKPKVFAEIFRVLRPGGRLFLSDIVVKDLPGWLREFSSFYSPSIVAAADEGFFVDRMREAGFSPVEVRERIMYSVMELKEFIRSETIPGASEAWAALGKLVTDNLVRRAARDLEGGVFRIDLYAGKPAS